MRFRYLVLVLLCAATLLLPVGAQAGNRVETDICFSAPAAQPAISDLARTVVWAAAEDTYYPLAEEIAQAEGLPLVGSLAEALAQEPAFLLWVAAPGQLSDAAVIELLQALKGQSDTVAVGLISGSSMDTARALYQRGQELHGERFAAASAANPAASITATLTFVEGTTRSTEPLSKEGLLRALQTADYVTFTGHGSAGYLRLDDETKLVSADLPELPPLVVATGSCNTFRPWAENSIALAFVDRGAAAYIGYVYSPNEGYSVGEFGGLPLRYTWPEFTIGQVVQAQNRGVLQGFGNLPYYVLLGDPRSALSQEPPYRLVDDAVQGNVRTLTFEAVPAGVVPVRIVGGAAYAYVQVAGISATYDGDPFYSSRLQSVVVGEDRLLLVEHPGGDMAVRLRTRTSLLWLIGHGLLSSLDYVLLFLPQGGGDILFLAIGVLVWLALLRWILRHRPARRAWLLACAAGLVATALQGLYVALRLGAVTITSKLTPFRPLSLAATLVLVAGASLLYLGARHRRGRILAVIFILAPMIVATLFVLASVGYVNLMMQNRIGAAIYNHHVEGLTGIALILGAILYPPALEALRRWHRPRHEKDTQSP